MRPKQNSTPLSGTLMRHLTLTANAMDHGTVEEMYLDLTDVIDLGNGSRLVRGSDSKEADWVVLTSSFNTEGTVSFEWKGELSQFLGNSDFISCAYGLVLDRRPDEKEIDGYLPLVNQSNGRQTMLHTLASSQEATALQKTIIIARRSALSHIERKPSGDNLDSKLDDKLS